MGGKGAAAAATSSIPGSSSSSSSSVCCMCGDHGLPQELFRCKACHFRSQHKYCSDLYPKEERYRVCNWCLREEGGRSSARESATAAAANNNNNISASSSTTSSGGAMLRRGSFPSSHVIKPIKKQPVPKRPAAASDATEQMGSADHSPGTLGRKRQGSRGKARRYKLLEEVSS